VDRDQIEPRHFTGWVEWARARGLPVDFNCSCFSHPLAATGYTISSFDERLRDFWIEHIKRCREIAAYLGRELGAPSLHNLWIPDGSKDATVFRHQHRDVLRGSLDEIFARDYPAEHLRDAVECKLFGLGSESYVVGSHEFYLGWALAHPEVLLCLDLGHFHPTESVADKISAVLLFVREILIHVSRGVRWDSDHVVIQNDDLTSLMQEIVRADALPRVRFATDFFDAELNRIGAWAVGARATLRTLLFALLEPTARLREFEAAGDYFGRLALLEEAKALPFGAVWDYFCRQQNVPVGAALIDAVHDYEQRVLRPRG
jgi:L-rhamnose isomerase